MGFLSHQWCGMVRARTVGGVQLSRASCAVAGGWPGSVRSSKEEGEPSEVLGTGEDNAQCSGLIRFLGDDGLRSQIPVTTCVWRDPSVKVGWPGYSPGARTREGTGPRRVDCVVGASISRRGVTPRGGVLCVVSGSSSEVDSDWLRWACSMRWLAHLALRGLFIGYGRGMSGLVVGQKGRLVRLGDLYARVAAVSVSPSTLPGLFAREGQAITSSRAIFPPHPRAGVTFLPVAFVWSLAGGVRLRPAYPCVAGS